jgi:hypothetical protein
MIPLIAAFNWMRIAVWAVVIASAASVVWMHGYSRGERKLFEYQAEQARAAVPVIVRQGEVTERVVTRYRDRIVQVKGETVTLEKEIPVYVPASADCVLARGWVQLHDAAATRTVPPAPGGVDVTAPAIAASTALQGVVENYAACHVVREQLLGLQAWVRGQYEAMNQEPLGY